MPQQLIYTSAPRGIVAGRSGHCTVARSATMREALMLQLEKFSYYQHLSLSGGQERPIFACRIVDIRGSRFHVLSRIQDAGLDFTGRTNFIAHHLVFMPEEIRQLPTPPVILRDWSGWAKSWTQEPQLLENEDWSALTALADKTNIPAQKWQQVTGDAVNGYGLLEARAGSSFKVDDQADEMVLNLFAESVELLDVRDVRKDFRSTAWNYTFTTSMQEQDNPADFRWRCIHSDNPAASRFTPPDCRPLSAVRANKWSGEETAFARTGRQAPRFVIEPQKLQLEEGKGEACFQSKAEGVPLPTYQWYSCDKDGKEIELLSDETKSELVLRAPPIGTTRYKVWASNSAGNAFSRVAVLELNKPIWERAKPLVSRIGVSEQSPLSAGQKLKIARDPVSETPQATSSDWPKYLAMALIFAGLIGGSLIYLKSKKSDDKQAEIQNITPQQYNNQSNSASASAQTNPQAETAAPPVPKPERPPPTDFQLPGGWARTLIGNVSDSNAEFITARFDLSCVAEGFLTNGDSFLFAHTANAKTDFQAALLQGDRPLTSRCGIMLRESEETDSPFLFIGSSPEKVFVYFRDGKSKFGSSEWEIPKADRSKQMYLRFQWQTNRIVPAYSFDLKKWAPETNTAFSNKFKLVGLAVSSGNSSNKVVAKFGGLIPAVK